LKERNERHLTTRDMERAAAGELEPDRMAHARACEECASAVEAYRVLAAEIGRAPHPSDMEPKTACASIEDLSRLASGGLAQPAAAAVLEHVSGCARCGAILRGALGEDSLVIEMPNASRRRIWRMAALAAGVAIAAIGGGLWLAQRNAPERLLAAAYTEERPFDLRLPSEGYGPVRQQRAGAVSALDRPRALAKAEVEIQGLPETPRKLALRGRAELLEGQFQNAIESLSRAQEAEPDNAGLLADLACAYLLRGDAEHRAIDYGHALDLLRAASKRQPNDPRTLFDLALAYQRAELLEEAIGAWQRYLAAERDPGWIAEGKRRLADLEARRKKAAALRGGVRSGPQAFLLAAKGGGEVIDPEQFEDIAWRDWLPALDRSPEAGEAFTALARSFMERYGDTSLQDAAQGARAGLDELAQAIAKNAAGEYDEALPLAREAAHLAVRANRAASLRARLELSYARQRATPAECLEIASGLRRDLAGTRYRWMSAQATMQEGICRLRAGESGAAGTLFQQAARMAEAANLRVLRLRAVGLEGNLKYVTGDLAGVWNASEECMREAWSLSAPAARFYQAEMDLARAANGMEWPQAAAAFAAAAARSVSETGNKLVGAGGHVYAAALLRQAGEEQEARRQLMEAEGLFGQTPQTPTVRSMRANARLGLLELEPAAGTSLEPLRQAIRDLDRASWDARFRAQEALARSLAAVGQSGSAKTAFENAIAIYRSELRSFSDPAQRIAGADLAAGAFKGLVQMQIGQDARMALATWKDFRGAQSPRESEPGPGVAVLHYAVLDRGIAAWAERDGAIEGRMVAEPTESVHGAQRRVLRACASPSDDTSVLRTEGRRLFGWLVQPFLQMLAGARTVVVDADDWLAGIPWAALTDEHGRFAVETWPFAMGRAAAGPAKMPRVVAISAAAPGSADGRFPPLETAAEEAREVAAESHGGEIVSSAAEIRAAMARAPKQGAILHFAGHGWSNAGDGGLVLPAAEPGAGPEFLGANQIARMDWRGCPLVVLSACMTGTGELRGPFNPRSLVRAFLLGGADGVIASSWNVDGAATARLMRTFYRRLAETGTAEAALALAQRELIGAAGLSHPYYWAAFAVFRGN